MTTFGKLTPGGTFDNVAADYAQASPYALGSSMTAASIKVYLDGNGVGVGSGPQAMRGVIYTDSVGIPNTLVVQSSPVSIAEAQAAGWVTFPLSPTVLLTSATYWIGFIADTPTNTARFTFDTVASQRDFAPDTYSDGAAATWNVGGSGTDGEQISVYVESDVVQVPQARFGRRGGMGRW